MIFIYYAMIWYDAMRCCSSRKHESHAVQRIEYRRLEIRKIYKFCEKKGRVNKKLNTWKQRKENNENVTEKGKHVDDHN